MPSPGNPPTAAYRRFEGVREYDTVIDSLIPHARRVIRVFDKTLSSAYNSPQRCEALRQFLLASRSNRLMIVLHEIETLERDCPRPLQLLRQFSHGVSVRQTLRGAKHVYDPFVIIDASHYVHRFHHDYLRCAQGTHDGVGARQLLDRFAEIWEVSAPIVSTQVSVL